MSLTIEERRELRDLEVRAREIRARQRDTAKAARPRQVAPLRTNKPDGALRERRPRQRDNAYLAFIRRLPCLACARLSEHQTTPTEAAHIRAAYPEPGWSYTGKAQKPDDWRTAPLCADHHQHRPDAQHKSNETAWWARLELYPPVFCARLREAYVADADLQDAFSSLVQDARQVSGDQT